MRRALAIVSVHVVIPKPLRTFGDMHYGPKCRTVRYGSAYGAVSAFPQWVQRTKKQTIVADSRGEIQIRPSRKWRFSRTGTQRTFGT